jgi:hypothetical protein
VELEWNTDPSQAPAGVPLLTYREPGMQFEQHHGDGVWTNQGQPQAWALWTGATDLGGPLSQRRFDLLSSAEPPKERPWTTSI